VGLAAAELERAGLSTVAIQFSREAAADAQPPRALLAPFRYGFPADPANEPGRLLSLMEAALALLAAERGSAPLLADYRSPSVG
jgi:hypothetical protein